MNTSEKNKKNKQQNKMLYVKNHKHINLTNKNRNVINKKVKRKQKTKKQ